MQDQTTPINGLLLVVAGLLASVCTVVAGLWLWQHQGSIVDALDPAQPLAVRWAIRCLAVGLLAAAQMTILAVGVGRFYRRTVVDRLLEWTFAGLFAVCLVSAIALGLVGK